jgi:uncharacterized membrane-anchored protein
MNDRLKDSLSKVPEVTIAFWVIKILATTLGETGGDAFSMTLDWGYALSSIMFAAIFLAVVTFQIKSSRFHPRLYWFVIIATTTLGTTMADFATRSLGIGYSGGSLILLILLVLSLAVWRFSTGSISVDSITTPKVEMFYWGTILFSQTLGTALGDWMADTNEFGYERGALVFAGALAIIAAAYYFTKISRTTLFWCAFILTRPLGATLGDLLDKPLEHGGFAFGRFSASGIIILLIVVCMWLFPQRAGLHPGGEEEPA